MKNSTNPAKRLYEILDQAIKSTNRPGVLAKEVWAQVFNIDTSNNERLLLRYSALVELTYKAKKCIEKIPNINQDLYLEPFSHLEKALAYSSLEGLWEIFINSLSPQTTMKSLAFCADTLSREGQNEKIIEPNNLKELENDISTLIENVFESELPENLKEILISNLEKIREAINNYRFYGARGLKEVYETNIGSIVINKVQIANHGDQELLKKYFKILTTLETLISFGLGLKELAGLIAPLLPSG